MSTTDVVIVGSGLNGCAAAELIHRRDPRVRVTVIDCGPTVTPRTGEHLSELAIPAAVEPTATTPDVLSPPYAGRPTRNRFDLRDHARQAGLYSLEAFGSDSGALAGAALAWNVGGMGIYWRAVTPTPPRHEMPNFLGDDEIRERVATASALLGVTPDPFPFHAAAHTEALTRGIATHFGVDSVEINHMPMAVRRDDDGRVRWNSPRTVLPALRRYEDNPWLSLLEGVICTRIDLHDGRASGVWIRDTETDREGYVAADAVVVAADALRTPQLLTASGVGLPAIGRHLNEHVVINAQVPVPVTEAANTADYEGIGAIAPMPQQKLPWHWEVSRAHLNARTELLSVSVYVPTTPNDVNRIEFHAHRDALKLPQMSINFSYSEADLSAVENAEGFVTEILPELGDFTSGRDLVRLKPGAALHYTGTVRMGEAAEESVCDSQCRIWGLDNVFVVGNGTLPNPLSCNPTLAGMALAARIGESVVAALA